MKKITAWLLAAALSAASLCGCGNKERTYGPLTDRAAISAACNMANREDLVWNYQSASDTWVMSPAVTVAYPENPAQQSISICIPGAYVRGIDVNGDGEPDHTSADIMGGVTGQLLVQDGSVITSSSGMEYHSGNAPVLLMNSSVYGEAVDTGLATDQYASEGYITVACGNRGTAPEGLLDLKNDVLFLKLNMAIGNLPGSNQEIISTGGLLSILTGVTAHHSEFFGAQADAGAFGIYRQEGDSFDFYSEEVPTIMLTDRVWGCLAADPVCSLYTEDLFRALERAMDPNTVYQSEFYQVLDQFLAERATTTLNDFKIGCDENEVGYDLNGNGVMEDKIRLYCRKSGSEDNGMNGFQGSFLNYYLALINREENIPTQEERAAIEAAIAIENMQTIDSNSAHSDESFTKFLDRYQKDLRALYREEEGKSYVYHPMYYMYEYNVNDPNWIRILEAPVTSEHSIIGALALAARWDAGSPDGDLVYAWDTNLSKAELERKYFPGIIDEMVRTQEIKEFCEVPSLSSVPLSELTPEMKDAAPLMEGEFAVSLGDALNFENIQMTNLPLDNDEEQKAKRRILSDDPDEDHTYYDVFTLMALEAKAEELEKLWK